MSGVTINLTGLGGLGVALLALALVSEKYFQDGLLYVICLAMGILAITVAISAKIYSIYKFSQTR